MRQDMFEVIIERPRRGGYGEGRYSRSKEKLRRGMWEAAWEGEDAELPPPDKSPIRDRYYSRRYLNENLQPLVRFLDSRVGRNWDDVYSEIKEHLSPRSAVQQHVIDHLKQYVVTSTVIEDGVIGYYPDNRFNGGRGFSPLQDVPGQKNYYSSREQFFVHPETKILSVYKRKKYRYDRRPIHEWVKIDDRHQYRKIGDVWFIVTLEDMRDNFWRTHPSGGIFAMFPWQARNPNDLPPEVIDFGESHPGSYPSHRLTNGDREREYGDSYLFSIEKRQCGKRELKKLRAILASRQGNHTQD